MDVRISTLNLKHGGVQTPDGSTDGDERWDWTVEAVRAETPDVLCLQEIHGWRDHNFQRLFRAEQDFRMRVAGWVPPVPVDPPGGGTLVMYRPRTGVLELDQWEAKESTALRNGMGVCVFNAAGVPLAVISLHLPPYDAALARSEAALAATRAVRYGGYGILAGDLNHFPLTGSPAPDPRSVPRLNVMGRWEWEGDATTGILWPDRRVAHALKEAGFTDAARCSDNPDAQKATGTGGVRVDQVWASWGAAAGIVSYSVLDTGASDHLMVTVDLDTEAFRDDCDGGI